MSNFTYFNIADAACEKDIESNVIWGCFNVIRYCNHILNDDIDECCSEMLQRLTQLDQQQVNAIPVSRPQVFHVRD